MDQQGDNPPPVTPTPVETVVVVKAVVKEALSELLYEVPAFRAFVSKPVSGGKESGPPSSGAGGSGVSTEGSLTPAPVSSGELDIEKLFN